MSTVRKIVKIDEDKCDGCGLCVPACHEGAIQIIDGKARLVSEMYCDGLGDCLGECPVGAITIEERPAEEFKEQAVKRHLAELAEQKGNRKVPSGCPGAMMQELARQAEPSERPAGDAAPSQLTNWPVQLKLVSPEAPYFENADLLLAADCVPFSLSDFHARFLHGRTLLIGCPKLDDAEFYVQKLTEILKHSKVRTLTVLHMEVPCCHGLSRIAHAALQASGKEIPTREVTVSLRGQVLEETEWKDSRFAATDTEG